MSRIGCRLILLNSGAELFNSIETPPGSLAYGKLLYGGVKRFRLLPGGRDGKKRRTSEILAVKGRATDNVPSWIQYGGPDRKYESIDMGAAGVLELYVLPQGKKMASFTSSIQDMALSKISWHPDKMFGFIENSNEHRGNNTYADTETFSSEAAFLAGAARNEAFSYAFKSKIGGLNSQIESIVRRVLDGRVIRPADEEIGDDGTADLTKTIIEAETLAMLGLTPVKGNTLSFISLFFIYSCGTIDHFIIFLN